MTQKNVQEQDRSTDPWSPRQGFSRQNIIELTRQAIAKAQPLAMNSDKVIILRKPPANAMVFADPEKFLRGMELLFSGVIATSPKESTIAIKILFRGLQVMIALEDQGIGLDTHTVDQILPDFDQVTWPNVPDPTDVTIPSNTCDVGHTTLHIRKLASTGKSSADEQVMTSAVLAFPRITFRQMT